MKNVWMIMSKEFARFFGDRRMILMTVLPAILIYVIYSFMGSMMGTVFSADEDHVPLIYAVNAPASIIKEAETVDVRMEYAASSVDQIEKLKNRITEKEADVLMIFPENFDDIVSGYDVYGAIGAAPNVEIYYNSTDPNSSQAFYTMTALFDAYESSISNKFDVNRGVESADLATAEEASATFISMLMPMLLMLFLYSGCMGLALESITGEKERGTLATLLVSPLKRSELAIGKILSLAVLSFISGITTAIATIISLPNLIGDAETISTSIYSAVDYALLVFIIITTLLLMVALLSIVSAFAKTMKEAGQAVTPLMIVIMVVGVSGMIGGAPTDPILYLVPLYGSVQSMNGIFSLDYSMLNVLLACFSTLAYAALGGFVLTKVFNSEKIMFSR